MESTAISKINNIPYCNSIYIEGYWNENYTEIESYEGVTSFSDDVLNPRYFRAKWGNEGINKKAGEYQEY